MKLEEYAALDAIAQADLIRRGEISPAALVETALTAIDARNPALNAVIHPRGERALHEARAGLPDGPFRGVPFLVKDLMCTTAGDPYHCGSRYLRNAGYTAPVDSFLAARYRQAGFAFLGRTNTPEFGTVTTTEPLAYGATHNPWDLARSPGGSSGGAAAAVASGMVAAAHGNDGGGSIRVPAAHCGLFGLKPSRGRISHGPQRGDVWLGAACEHVLTRSVRDSAALLDVASGPHPGDPCVAPSPDGSFVAAAARPPARLRIGFMDRAPTDGSLDTACREAVVDAARLLESLGHHVAAAHPPALDEVDEQRSFMRVVSAWLAHDVDELARALGRAPRDGELEAHNAAVYMMGRELTATDYLAAQVYLQSWSRRIASWWETWDLLLTPTTAAVAPLLGAAPATVDDPLAPLRATLPYIAFTSPFNVSGQPAASLPLYWTAEGLPIGVQLVAAYAREDLVLAVAAELEAAHSWAHRRPSAVASRAG